MSTITVAKQIPMPGAEAFEKPPENSSLAILRIIERAVLDPAFDPAKLAVLLEVQLKYEANEARKAYIAAMQQFKANPPDINKTKQVVFATSGGDKTEFWHPELDKITEDIARSLRAVGITHSWKTSDANGRTTVTCVLTHELGHSEEAATLAGPPDTSGKKNSIQAIGSTVTYLQRYTLLSATGLAAKGMDDDGKTEGLSETAIDEYCNALKDSSSLEEVKRIFGECWNKAKSINDRDAQARFQKVYEARKRELLKERA